ncbi:MAG TPA: hypothetical protein VHA15_11345 [Burkholderiales bacterium]|jgi:hypothetical protein|nr:hypothetical protein [Burkholderiales bacterium]
MRTLLLLAGLLACASVHAQLNQAIPDSELFEPWTLAQAAAKSAASRTPADAQRAAVAAAALDATLAALRDRFEDTAIRIVARPEFSYDAAQTSYDMSMEVGQAAAGFDAWLGQYPQDDAGDAAAARAALSRLQAVLAQRNAFERDVFLAVGSGSKHAIQALSRRWWTASEHVEGLRLAISPR